MSQTRTLSSAAAAVLAALAVSACGGLGAPAADMPLTPLSRYALQVEPGLDRIALAVHEDGLSANQESAVNALAARYAASGYGALIIQAPSGDDPVAARAVWTVHAALVAFGVPESQLRVVSYVAPDPRAPVLAGFETLQAAIPNCALEQGPREARFSNQSSRGLGCAVNANMAAQIANPRDIIQPRDMPPAETGRAATVFANYRQGEPTAGAQEELVAGRISRAVE